MNFKEFLKQKGISEDDFAKKTPQEMAELHTEFSNKQIDDLKELIGKAAKPEDVQKANEAIEALKKANDDALKGYVKSEDFDTLKKILGGSPE